MDPRATIFLAADHAAELHREAERHRLARAVRGTGSPSRRAGAPMMDRLAERLRVLRRADVRRAVNLGW